jgi:methyl-accepting chemotaxis protein
MRKQQACHRESASSHSSSGGGVLLDEPPSKPRSKRPPATAGRIAGKRQKRPAANAIDPELFADYAAQVAAIRRSQGVVSFDTDGIILDVNQIYLKSLGYTLEEVKGKHHSSFVDEGFRQSSEYQEFWARLRRGEYFAAAGRRFGKNGREKVVGYSTDVTAQKMGFEGHAGGRGGCTLLLTG